MKEPRKMHPSPIRTTSDFPFAHHTMCERLPTLIQQIISHNDLTSHSIQSLEELASGMHNNAPLPAPSYPAPDASLWLADFERFKNDTWLNTEWYFGEMLFFREVINRVGFWQNGTDPYKPFKKEELHSDSLSQQLETALSVDGSPTENLRTMLHLALWGNRADLSLPEVVELGQHASDEDLLIDDSDTTLKLLLNAETTKPVHLITDNFGTELAMDIMLIYHLLQQDIPVAVHVKMTPTYVSDATASDFRWMLKTLPELNSQLATMTQYIHTAFNSGKLKILPDFYWHTARWYDEIPVYLHTAFSQARVIISKGDANYRRALYDTIWDTEMPIDRIVSTLPAPFLALRTLKSDPIVGITSDHAKQLTQETTTWRTSGKYGVIQLAQ